ncbi:MAG: transposase, partial [Limnospira sp. PMC 917.15]|nr:transposase [Limnospira sp. PMC 917.15]
YPRLTKGLTFMVSEPIPNTCGQGTQLVFTKGRWLAIVPEPVAVTPTEATGVSALDPGVRTFITGFDGSRL